MVSTLHAKITEDNVSLDDRRRKILIMKYVRCKGSDKTQNQERSRLIEFRVRRESSDKMIRRTANRFGSEQLYIVVYAYTKH